MADSSDVENAIAAFIDGVIYPNGDTSPDALGALGSLGLTAHGTGGTPGTYPLTFTGGGGSGASGTYLIGPDGTIVPPLFLANRGSLYITLPTVGFGGGSGITGATAIVTPAQYRIFRGWPDVQQLDIDLAAGNAQISIFLMRPTHRTTRYPKEWQTSAVHAPTLTVSAPAAAAGNTWALTFGGSGGAGQTAGVLVARVPYVRVLSSSDTPTTVAAVFAGAIPGATSLGAVLSIPAAGTDTPIARIVGSATGWIENRRQEQDFQVDFWCPDPTMRDALVSLVDAQFANTDWLTTSDNSACRITLRANAAMDDTKKDNLFRRCIIYCVEYPTTFTPPLPIMLFGDLHLTPSIEGGPPGTTLTIYL